MEGDTEKQSLKTCGPHFGSNWDNAAEPIKDDRAKGEPRFQSRFVLWVNLLLERESFFNLSGVVFHEHIH